MAKVDLEELLKKVEQGAIDRGVYELLHGETKGFAEYIDNEKIDKAVNEAIGKNKSLSQSDLVEIQKEIINGIKGGKYLTEKGKKIILQEAIEPKSLLEKIKYAFSGSSLSYVSKAAKVSSQLYDLIKLGGYNLPELEEKANELKNLGFYKAAVGILKEEGLLKGYDVHSYRKEVEKNAKKGLNELTEIVKYKAFPQAASIIIMITGVLMLAFASANISGFAIAGTNVDSAYPIAIGFILLVISLFFSVRKHKTKSKKR